MPRLRCVWRSPNVASYCKLYTIVLTIPFCTAKGPLVITNIESRGLPSEGQILIQIGSLASSKPPMAMRRCRREKNPREAELLVPGPLNCVSDQYRCAWLAFYRFWWEPEPSGWAPSLCHRKAGYKADIACTATIGLVPYTSFVK